MEIDQYKFKEFVLKGNYKSEYKQAIIVIFRDFIQSQVDKKVRNIEDIIMLNSNLEVKKINDLAKAIVKYSEEE